MASQPSGSKDELLFIETEYLYFIIKGEPSSVGYGTERAIKVLVNEQEEMEVQNASMYFKEYTNYEVIIEKKEPVDIEFYHENIHIRNKVTPTGRTRNVLSGIINFRGDIGFSDLYVKVKDRVHLKVTIEVMPSKLDYKEDYKAILEDVNREIYNLAYGFLSRTYLSMEINNKKGNSSSEFYSILNYVYEKLMKAINLVIANPHHQLAKESKVLKHHLLKNTNRDTLKWLEKRPHLIKETEEGYIPIEALQVSKRVTFDTKENRFLKFMLLKITNKINGFIKSYEKSSIEKDPIILNRLKTMEREITRTLKTSFLKNVGDEYRNGEISLVFTMGSGYREIYKYYLMLQKGLSINSNILSLSMKDLAVLYEYWCFIKINSLLQERYKLITADFMKVHREGIYVVLKKGVASRLVYENPDTKERFEVAYNALKDSKTIAQKPDNILSIYKEGCSKAYEFIFDAKYKIDTTAKYCEKYHGIGPKEEDINTMHRYRDAILHNNKSKTPYKNTVFGAFVLFPYNNETEYKKHSFYESIEEVNIGAFPFLPSTTGLMREFLDKLIHESSYSTFERSLDRVGREAYIKEEDFKRRNVLVGALRNKEQLPVNLEGCFYHIPCSNINLAQHSIQYIALAQSRSSFGEEAGIQYYGAVKHVKVVKRREITAIPKDSDTAYYFFEVEQWEKLDKKIAVSGYQVMKVLYTSEFLLKNAKIVTELCIKTKEEYRLWQELKRMYSDVSVHLEKNISTESKLQSFSVHGIDIAIKEDGIAVGNTVLPFTREDFNRKPRMVMDEIGKRIKER